jgi:hypothetical protein
MNRPGKLYTFFFEYDGGTYIRQTTGGSLVNALKNWAETLTVEEIEGAHEGFKQQLLEGVEDEIKNQDVVAITGLKSVWCCSFLFSNDSVGIVTITSTDERE